MKQATKDKTEKQSIRLFLTIADLPMWNWEQVRKTSDLRYLIKLEDYDYLPEAEVSEDTWNTLQDEFQEKCGMTGSGGHYFDKMIELWELKRDRVIYECDEYNSKLSKTKVKIALLEDEIDERPIGTQTIEDQAVALEIFFAGREFDLKKISVLRYHKYLNEYEKRTNELANSPKSAV